MFKCTKIRQTFCEKSTIILRVNITAAIGNTFEKRIWKVMKGIYFDNGCSRGELYTDLAVERRRANTDIPGVKFRTYEGEGGVWECVRIASPAAAESIGRPMGIYDTLNTGSMEMLDEEEIEDAAEDIARKLCEIFDEIGVLPARLLVCGLGNRRLTPDSVGPKAADAVRPTMHIRELDEEALLDLECSEIGIITPDVMGESGMDALDILRGVCEEIIPDAVIAIDAIATRSAERLGSTVQISSSGILPGGGVGNYRSIINEESLGIPVIAIGVPTVIDARALVGKDERASRYSGLIVAPKDADAITDTAARIISMGINQAFGI